MNHLVSLKAVAAPALCTVVALMAPAQVLAASEAPGTDGAFYAVAGLQHSKVEDTNIKGMGYSLGTGYRLNEQWAVELTALQLMDKKYGIAAVPAPAQAKSYGLGLSALGSTALDDSLSVFYRAGAYLLKHETELPTVSSISQNGDTTITNIRYQKTDLSKTHAVLGLGLEQQWSADFAGRLELEHIFKNNGISLNTVRLSAVYRF